MGGILDSCSFDFLTRDDFMMRSYGMALLVFNFVIPVSIIAGAYIMIVKAICDHEAAMRAQAAKMNVKNLRGNADADAMSAEVRIAKVAITNVTLWLVCWLPYVWIVVYAINHPKFRLAMTKSYPGFCINEKEATPADN